MLGGKRNEGCKDKKRGGRPKVLNKTALIAFSLEQLHEKQTLETPEMAKKNNPLLRPPSNVQLVSNLYRSRKALLRGRDDFFSWINAQNILFQLWFRGRSGSCILGDNKAEYNYSIM